MKDKITVVLFVIILFVFSLATLFIKDKEISLYERRKLTTTEALKEDFFDNMEDYVKDQFFLRDILISVNSVFDRYILQELDSNDVYIKNGYIIEKNYPLNELNIENFIKKINFISDTYLKNSNVFYAVIPDKSFFLDDNKFLKMDFNYIFKNIKEKINIKYIDITNLLSLEDYYKTDIHIRQEQYPKIINRLNEFMKFNYLSDKYEITTYDNFYGASYNKVPVFTKPDTITILANETINGLEAVHLEYGKKSIYELNKLDDVDAYNVYLGGPSAFIQIDNQQAETDRELIIFRDSFGSSLAPLLINSYRKITLIDLRYMKMDLASNYVDFNNKDVLFLYSTLIVNNSYLLKVEYK